MKVVRLEKGKASESNFCCNDVDVCCNNVTANCCNDFDFSYSQGC